MAVFIHARGVAQIAGALALLGPELGGRVWPQALRAAVVPVRRQARRPNYVFRDGTGVRAFDRRRGRSQSVRLRSTIRFAGIGAYYGSRFFRRGRYAVYIGRRGARHGYVLHEGHGGPIPAGPRRVLTDALESTQNESRAAFTRIAQMRFPLAARAARRTARSLTSAAASRTVARRARRRT